MEHQLYDQFFPESDSDGSALAPLMDPLCTVLYDALRPVFIQLQSLEALCSLVDILQHEVHSTRTTIAIMNCIVLLQLFREFALSSLYHKQVRASLSTYGSIELSRCLLGATCTC